MAHISPNFKEKFTLFNIGVFEKDFERFLLVTLFHLLNYWPKNIKNY